MISSMPRNAFALKTRRELCHPKCARKVSGLSRNGSQAPVVRGYRYTLEKSLSRGEVLSIDRVNNG